MSGQSEANHPVTISLAGRILLAGFCVLFGTAAQAQIACTAENSITANIVAMDQPVLFNRIGASNVNGMIFALGRDVVTINQVNAITADAAGNATTIADLLDVQVVAPGEPVVAGQIVVTEGADGILQTVPASGESITLIDATTPIATENLAAFVGNVALRPDKRPRPLVLRIAERDCLTINLTNLLTPAANPINPLVAGGDPLPGNDNRPSGPNGPDAPPIDGINTPIDDQVLDRHVSFHVAGMQWIDGPADDSSYVGNPATNADSTVPQGGFKSYRLYAEQEGVFIARGMAATVGSDANQGNASNLLFGQVIVEPIGASIYRSQTTEEEMRLASTDLDPASPTCGERNLTPAPALQPIIDYEALYPIANCDNGVKLGADAWMAEGKAGLPILNMIDANNEIVHSEINGLIVGPDADGSWRTACADGTRGAPDPNGDCPYPLESIGKRNPVLPNRLEAFRDFASVWHDEPATAQAFPGFYKTDPVFRYVLAGVKDGFMINYGSGGIGSEIIANRLGVGPMHDCLTCAYEEFFLTSYTVGDPAQLSDVAANMGLEDVMPDLSNLNAVAQGPKATYVPYPADPANVHHSYIGDFTKFRNTQRAALVQPA